MLRGPKKRRPRKTLLRTYVEPRRKISDTAIIRGVEVEFDRTLPFWRCFTDLQQETRHKPEVVDRKTQLLCRIPCKVFKRVDVVWAQTQVQLRGTGSRSSHIHKTVVKPKGTLGDLRTIIVGPPCKERHNNVDPVVYTIDTLHFVHNDAYRKGAASEHSFHIQSVVLRDEPAVLQCVAGAMVSFSFLIYTSLRLVHARSVSKCSFEALARALDAQAQAYTRECQEAAAKRVKHEEIDNVASSVTTSSLTLCSAAEVCFSKSSQADTAFAQLRKRCPPSTSRVLILGMGGNSMALALRAVLGPAALIEVVEVEPAVVAACLQAGTLRNDDQNMKVHLKDADACLRELPDRTYDFIYMDIFEPMQATMKNLHPWVVAAREKLTAGGLLVMNEHQLPSAEGLAPYVKLFGDGNVQAVNLRGWNESVVVCVAPGNAETDTHSLEISKCYTNVAFNIYEALMPGWLPHFSWLVVAKTHQFKKMRSRLWTS